jgi:type II secretory pathway component PulC
VVKQQLNIFIEKSVQPFIKEMTGIFEELLAPLFATEWGLRASWGAAGLFALLFLVTLIKTGDAWYQDFVITHSQSRTHVASKDNMMQMIAQIPEEHLFGKVGLNGSVPITSLQLRLIGVIKSDPENFSRVIISESGQPGKVYGIGDSLPSGITINSIVDDGVILENDGRLEKLPLQRSPLVLEQERR